jgi:GDP-mannose transporter
MEIGFIVSMALVLMIYTGSKALQYMTIPLFTIFKNLTIIMIAFGERLYFNGSPVSSLMMIAFSFMVLSSVVAGMPCIDSLKKDGLIYLLDIGQETILSVFLFLIHG